MFDFRTSATTKAEQWDDVLSAAKAVMAGEHDAVANMANVAAILFHGLPDLNWAGFYRMVDGELVLGPFQGKAACIRIAIGKGVCGTAAATGETQVVEDVHAFAGHIACDADSRSELVVPFIVDGRIAAVIDLDSPIPGRFDADDAKGCEALAEWMGSNSGRGADRAN